MSSIPSTLNAVAQSLPLISTVAAKLQSWWANRKNVHTVCAIIPAGSGKSTLVSTFQADFGTSYFNQVTLLDVEAQAVLANPTTLTPALKQTNIFQYNQLLFPACQAILTSTQAHLNQIQNGQLLVVLVSTNDLKKYLKLSGMSKYFAPAKGLFKTILQKNPAIADYLTYCRTTIESKDPIIFNDFQELYSAFLSELKIVQTVS